MSHTLGELIAALEAADPDYTPPIGFGEPMSYRGYYTDVAFPPKRGVPVREMLSNAKSALGETFEGYKGGEYKMEEYTDCWISEYGQCDGDGIGPVMRAYLTGRFGEIK